MVVPLSFASQTGYYGLRVNPTLEQVVGSVRKPVRIPLPDRSHKWYALSPYRAHMLDAARKQNEYDQGGLDYRTGGGELPKVAARLLPWDEAADAGMFRDIHRQGDARDAQVALAAAVKNTRAEQQREAESTRREMLRHAYVPNRMHPVIEAAHSELEQAGVPHNMPDGPKLTTAPKAMKAPPKLMAAEGQPQAPQFPSFEFLNLGDVYDFRVANPSCSRNMTYEHIRDVVAAQPTLSS